MFSDEYYQEAYANDMDAHQDYQHMCMPECVDPARRVDSNPFKTAQRPAQGPDARTLNSELRLSSLIREIKYWIHISAAEANAFRKMWHNPPEATTAKFWRQCARASIEKGKLLRQILRSDTDELTRLKKQAI